MSTAQTARDLGDEFTLVRADETNPGEAVDLPFRIQFPRNQEYTNSTRNQSSGSGGPGEPGRSRLVPVPIPIPIPASIGSIIDMTKWAVAVTPNRVQFLRWLSLLIIKGLCLLTNLLFWVFAVMFAKTLPTWTGLTLFMTILWRCRPFFMGGGGFVTFLGIWQDLFAEAEVLEAQSLQIVLYQTGDVGAIGTNLITVPLLVKNPIFWACATAITFICHCILSFIYRCLSPVDRVRVRTGERN
jgi:hypothetical protein